MKMLSKALIVVLGLSCAVVFASDEGILNWDELEKGVDYSLETFEAVQNPPMPESGKPSEMELYRNSIEDDCDYGYSMGFEESVSAPE